MIPIAQLKKDLEFYRSLTSLVEVLKLIAAAQYQILEKKIKTYAAYLEAVSGFFGWLDMQKAEHPFLRQTDKPAGVIAVTTDAGLLGGMNAQVVTQALQQIEKENGKIIIIGRRGELYVQKRTLILANFPGISDEQRYAQALQMRDYVVRSVLEGKVGTVKIVYPRALSFTSQRVETEQLLPFVPAPEPRLTNVELSEILLESSVGGLAEYLIYLWLGQKLFEVFGLSRLAEQAARFMHLENCTQRIREMDQKLQFQYFRLRHEKIDQNMRELFAARMIHS